MEVFPWKFIIDVFFLRGTYINCTYTHTYFSRAVYWSCGFPSDGINLRAASSWHTWKLLSPSFLDSLLAIMESSKKNLGGKTRLY